MSESFVYVTCESDEQAQSLGKAIVSERLVACVNILNGMKSLYWWEGTVQSGNETVLIAKTTNEKLEKVIQRVKELHSYDVPCVVALPIIAGNPDFLHWIRTETTQG